jgi:cell shape-determining protein MreC
MAYGSAKHGKSAAVSTASKERAKRLEQRSLKNENQSLKAALLAKEKEIKLLQEMNEHLKNAASHQHQAGYYD